MTTKRPAGGKRDALLPFVFEQASARGALVYLAATSREILDCHPYPRPLAHALAELLAASALLAASLKLDGSLIVQLSGDGPVRLIVVECDDALALRATAQWNAARVALLGGEASLADLAGGATRGRLTLTLDQRNTGTLYQGIVGLESTSIAASIQHYLATSEQLQSRLWLVVHDTSVWGLMLQRMPQTGDVDAGMWARLVAGAEAAMPRAVVQPEFADALRALFPHDDVRIFDERPVTFRCKCSLARVVNALRIAGCAEVEAALAERGSVDVTCEFCNRRYTFAPREARALFTDPSASRRSASAR